MTGLAFGGAAKGGTAQRRGPASGRLLANLAVLAALAAWWVYAQFVPAYQMPGPLPVAQRMAEFLTDPHERVQLLWSLFHVCSAIAISFVTGLVLAVASYSLWPLRGFIDDRLTPFLNAFSGIGWLFLAMMWFGVSSVTVIFAVTIILVPFAVINIRTGLQELDQDLAELGRSLTRRRRRIFVKLTIPMLVPYLFATLRTAFGVAWKVVLTSELFGGSAGVGQLLNAARQEFDTETMFAVIGFIILFIHLTEVVLFAPIQRQLKRRFARD